MVDSIGSDTFFGGSGNDHVGSTTGSDPDLMHGGAGDDKMYAGDDVAFGGGARDRIKGGHGIDACRSPTRAPGCNR